MKIFAVLVLTLVAQIYSTSGENFENTFFRQYEANSNHGFIEENQSSENSQMELFSQLREALRDTLPAGSSQFQSSASQLPRAESYKTKILNRLQGSESAPELKQKLIKVADQKLDDCKALRGDELDRRCVDRLSGQIMQLIAAMENVNRPIAPVEAQRRQFH